MGTIRCLTHRRPTDHGILEHWNTSVINIIYDLVQTIDGSLAAAQCLSSSLTCSASPIPLHYISPPHLHPSFSPFMSTIPLTLPYIVFHSPSLTHTQTQTLSLTCTNSLSYIQSHLYTLSTFHLICTPSHPYTHSHLYTFSHTHSFTPTLTHSYTDSHTFSFFHEHSCIPYNTFV